jgi:hypothetical protein
MTAVRGHAELSGPEALANRPDNSFELRWVTADRFAELILRSAGGTWERMRMTAAGFVSYWSA